jgi:hypothetical protein
MRSTARGAETNSGAAVRAVSREVKRACCILYQPNDVVEVRVPDGRRTRSAYFNNPDLLSAAPLDVDG